MKIGVTFGNPETTTGGNALKFYASIRIETRKGDKITDSEGNVLGNEIKVKVVKNKVAPPFKETELLIIYSEGIDKFYALIQAALETGVIQKTAGWYKYKDKTLGNGIQNIKENLKNDSNLTKQILEEVRQKLG